MAVQYISTRLIMDLCDDMDMTPGERVGMQWWEQADIYLVGERDTEASAVEVEKDGMEE